MSCAFSALLVVVWSPLLLDTLTVGFGGTARPGPEVRTSRLGPETSLLGFGVVIVGYKLFDRCNSDQGTSCFKSCLVFRGARIGLLLDSRRSETRVT